MPNDDTQGIKSIDKVMDEMDEMENKLFREAIKRIVECNNFQMSKDEIGNLVLKLENLYVFNEKDEMNTPPRYALKKLLYFVKSSVEQYMKSTNDEKEKYAGKVIENLWKWLSAFFTEKQIPPNIYDIVVENNTNIARIKDLEEKSAKQALEIKALKASIKSN